VPGPRALWRTTCQSVTAWSAWLPELSRCRPRRAWTFALLSELTASTSLCAIGALAIGLVFPNFARILAQRTSTWLWLLTATLGFALFMVALHALWALCLELLLRLEGKRADTDSSLSFGLYACGWDLLTSPAGLLLAVVTLGPKSGWQCVRQAALVPKHALTDYLLHQRDVRPDRAMTIAVLSFLASVLVLILTCGLPIFASVFGQLSLLRLL